MQYHNIQWHNWVACHMIYSDMWHKLVTCHMVHNEDIWHNWVTCHMIYNEKWHNLVTCQMTYNDMWHNLVICLRAKWHINIDAMAAISTLTSPHCQTFTLPNSYLAYHHTVKDFFKLWRHNHETFYSLLNVPETGPDNWCETVEANELLYQNCVHRLFIQNRKLHLRNTHSFVM